MLVFKKRPIETKTAPNSHFLSLRTTSSTAKRALPPINSGNRFEGAGRVAMLPYENRILDSTGKLERTIALDESDRKL
jgi:hypothetical protein